MTKFEKEEAIEHIKAQLEDGYIDLGVHDQDELTIIKEAMDMWKIADKWNEIPESYIIADWEKLGYNNEEAKNFAEASKIYI